MLLRFTDLAAKWKNGTTQKLSPLHTRENEKFSRILMFSPKCIFFHADHFKLNFKISEKFSTGPNGDVMGPNLYFI